MAKKTTTNTRTSKNRKGGSRFRKIGDTERWVYGFTMMFLSLFVLLAVVSYYFTWSDDQTVLREGIKWSEMTGVKNAAGKLGAVVGATLVGRWFGAFALCIPIVLIILSLRIMRVRPLFLNRSVRITTILMLLGSLTLGYLFGTQWGIFGTGLGGETGIAAAEWIGSMVGKIGFGLLLVMAWILVGVYINRSTIKFVNRMGQAVSQGAVELVNRNQQKHVSRKEARREEKRRLAEEKQRLAEEMEREEMERLARQAEEDMFETGDIAEPSGDIDIQRADDTGGEIPDPMAGVAVKPSGDDVLLEVVDNQMPEGNAPGDAGDGSPFAGDEDDDFLVVDESGQHVKASSFRGPGRVARERPNGVIVGAGGVVVGDDEGITVVKAENRDAEAEEEEANFRDPTRQLPRYQRPPWVILKDHSVGIRIVDEEIRANQEVIREKLEDFGIRINERIKATIGPTVTLYEIEPAQGVKISRIRNLEEDIALALKVQSIRIVTLGQGRGTVGIEVPNSTREIVSMLSVIKSIKFQDTKAKLPIALGKTIYNEIYIGDLTKMPHLLVAGATGQGKSVGLNAIITSLIYKKHPAELKFVLIDPKQVELSLYSKLENYFLAKMDGEENAIITDTTKAVDTLNSLVMVMEERYTLLNKAGERNISDYNEQIQAGRLKQRDGHAFMPYIVVIIDEFADMIMTAGREAEIPITRLAAKARAVGIHLIVATQRPDVKVITGLIKSNIPARIAFKVVSMVDSRTIIDQPGANNLIGMGDMLMYLNGELTRIQCAFIDTPEIENVVSFVAQQDGFGNAYLLPHYESKSTGGAGSEDGSGSENVFVQVAYFVVQNQQGSTSAIQRNFRLGYNRAGRIMDKLEKMGIVGRQEGSKPRDVIVSSLGELDDILATYDEEELNV